MRTALLMCLFFLFSCEIMLDVHVMLVPSVHIFYCDLSMNLLVYVGRTALHRRETVIKATLLLNNYMYSHWVLHHTNLATSDGLPQSSFCKAGRATDSCLALVGAHQCGIPMVGQDVCLLLYLPPVIKHLCFQ